MAEWLRTFLVVSVLALVVWLFGEAESLDESEVRVRLDIAAGDTSMLIRAETPDPRVTLGLRGEKSALLRARSKLESGIRLEPGVGIPETNGAHRVDLAQALRRHPDILSAGVSIEWVRPPTLMVEVEPLVVTSLPVLAQLTELETVGEVTVVPPEAELRVPSKLIEEGRLEGLSIVAAPTSEQFAPGPQTITEQLRLPLDLRGTPGITLLTESVRLSFEVVSTLETRTFPAVPVQVLLAPIETDEWRVSVSDEDQILSLEVTGPRAVIDRLASAGSRIVAILPLSDIDLQSGVSAKPIEFAVLLEGRLKPLPTDVTVRSEKTEVGFVAERKATP